MYTCIQVMDVYMHTGDESGGGVGRRKQKSKSEYRSTHQTLPEKRWKLRGYRRKGHRKGRTFVIPTKTPKGVTERFTEGSHGDCWTCRSPADEKRGWNPPPPPTTPTLPHYRPRSHSGCRISCSRTPCRSCWQCTRPGSPTPCSWRSCRHTLGKTR